MKLLIQQHAHKAIILTISILMILSVFWLSWREHADRDFGYEKNWWSVAFVEPHGENLDFMIDNYSDEEVFSYSIVVDDDVRLSEELRIEKNRQNIITIDEASLENTQNTTQKIVITISAGKETQDIYKIF